LNKVLLCAVCRYLCNLLTCDSLSPSHPPNPRPLQSLPPPLSSRCVVTILCGCQHIRDVGGGVTHKRMRHEIYSKKKRNGWATVHGRKQYKIAQTCAHTRSLTLSHTRTRTYTHMRACSHTLITQHSTGFSLSGSWESVMAAVTQVRGKECVCLCLYVCVVRGNS